MSELVDRESGVSRKDALTVLIDLQLMHESDLHSILALLYDDLRNRSPNVYGPAGI